MKCFKNLYIETKRRNKINLPSISEELIEFDTCDSVEGESNTNDLKNKIN